jgi:pimeloyl-ACP methyl ester carboxylesterase
MPESRTRLMIALCCTAAIVSFAAGCAPVATVSQIEPHRSGFSTNAKAPLAALSQSVDAANNAWQRLEKNPGDTVALKDYNFAVSRIIETLEDANLKPWNAPIKVGSRTLAWKRNPRPQLNPAPYVLIPADQLKIRGTFVSDRETKAGLGAPLVAKRIAKQVDDYAPTPHFYYSFTAVARFEGSRCVLAFEDALENETVTVGGHTFPLAADFTAPLAMMLVEMQPKKLGLPRLMHPAEFAKTTRIARLEPFDPNKTVVLLVHGLMDSPATWFPLLNYLRADEDIRQNYQFWFFSYPTGYPYSYSAAMLRKELDAAEEQYPMRKKMVVVGHSMGGCITRILVTDSGDKVWNAMFTVSPEQMDVSPAHKHILTESTIFEHRPEIGRVIFISSPHRGSELASNWVGRIGSSLVQVPKNLLSVGREEERYEKHTAGDQHLDRFPDSVDMLAPNNDFVHTRHSLSHHCRRPRAW